MAQKKLFNGKICITLRGILFAEGEKATLTNQPQKNVYEPSTS